MKLGLVVLFELSVGLLAHIDDVKLEDRKCPPTIFSVGVSPDRELLILTDRDNRLWTYQHHLKTLVHRARPIAALFPRGPSHADVLVSDHARIALIKEKQVHVYEQTERDVFNKLETPTELNARLVFYPKAGLSYNNDTVLLINGGVLAFYSLATNSPSLLQSRDEWYPNLPENLLSAVPRTADRAEDLFELFSEDGLVRGYNLTSRRVLWTKHFTDYLNCK